MDSKILNSIVQTNRKNHSCCKTPQNPYFWSQKKNWKLHVQYIQINGFCTGRCSNPQSCTHQNLSLYVKTVKIYSCSQQDKPLSDHEKDNWSLISNHPNIYFVLKQSKCIVVFQGTSSWSHRNLRLYVQTIKRQHLYAWTIIKINSYILKLPSTSVVSRDINEISTL